MPKVVKKSEHQKVAEAQVESFHDNLGPFVVAAETTRMPMVFTDAIAPDNPIIFANDSFLSLTGYPREEVLGQKFNFLLANGADGETTTRVVAEFAGKAGEHLDMLCRRKDGTEFWAGLLFNPVRDEGGKVIQHFVSLVDLTRHKNELVQSKMLIDELNHRVKNTLSTVQSIVWQALRTVSDPTLLGEAIESRLLALSRSHDLLTREKWKSARLTDIVHDALEPFGISDGDAERITIKGINVRFPPKAALALGIAFNELATNAVKYGALSNAAGSILIEWTIEPSAQGDRLILTWTEKGGPSVSPPSRKGFGSRMIEQGLTHELEGTAHLDYTPEGLICTMNFPAQKVIHYG
ncbi:MAG TPA: HWE histidine kinase domain-containing protein [Aestuariivirga sp.]|nr:HWE histidine kinase domain-containing protein [Aestuariivirga sp.]